MDQRIRDVIQKSFVLKYEPIEYSQAGIKEWDSLGHLSLIMELETEFNVQFPMKSIPYLISLDKIKEELWKMM
jgi:acyl carrier protein